MSERERRNRKTCNSSLRALRLLPLAVVLSSKKKKRMMMMMVGVINYCTVEDDDDVIEREGHDKQ